MKLIYVASPYAGDVKKNIEFAKRACRYVMEQGQAFFAPHLLYPQILDDTDPEERKTGIKLGLRMLEKCDELWVNVKNLLMKSRAPESAYTQARAMKNFA